MVNKTGKFVISLDTEIAWGWMSFLEQRNSYYPLFEKTQETIVRLLDVFDQYDVAATWAIVGRLLEAKEDRNEYFKHNLEKLFGTVNNETLFEQLPEHYLSFPNLIDLIKKSKANHEVASHTYNHLYTQNLQNKDSYLLTDDIQAMEKLFVEQGLHVESLVFPKNQVGFLDLIGQSGIKIYRSPDEYWYSKYANKWVKIFRQIDNLFPITPSVFDVEQDKFGTKFIKGSYLFKQHHTGLKKLVPLWVIKRKAIKGIKRAIREKKIFHLWFHPFNFAYKTDGHLEVFAEVLKFARKMEDKGDLKICTMRDLN